MTRDELLDALASSFDPADGVTVGRIFSGRGLRVEAGFFAFIDSTGRLVIKVPEDEAGPLIAAGRAEPKAMGQRVMREWVSLGASADAPDDGIVTLLRRARDYVATAS